MLRGVTDSVCKLLAAASCSSRSCSISYWRRYSIFSGQGATFRAARTSPQLCCPSDQLLSNNSFSRGASGESWGIRVPSFLLVLRKFGAITQGRKGKVDSFSTVHVAADGREFRYATVMVPDMKEGDSALQAWTHACSLIGDSRCPTLAVAFVSKATKSAIAAVKEISQLLLKSRSGSLAVAEEHGAASDGQVRAVELGNVQVQSRTEDSTGAEMLTGKPHGVRIASIHTDLSRMAAQGDASGSGEDVSSEDWSGNIPLIGCVASGWAEELGRHWRLVGSVPASDSIVDLGTKKAATKRTFKKFELGDGSKGIVCDMQTAQDLFGDLTGDRERFLAVAAEVLDSEDDEGTLSDWEHLSAEVLQPDSTDSGIQVEGAMKTSEGFVVDINISDWVGSGGSSSSATTALEGSLELRTQDQEPCEYAIDHGRLHASEGIWSESNDDDVMMSNEDFENSAWQGKGRKYVLSRQVRETGKNEDEDDSADGKYQLMICVGHFPGTKAVSFHSSSTGLPSLPNLEDAVLMNNPHMLLLGAPGFKFPDFIQRLSSVFPNSSRAGAFLLPLFSSIRSQLTKIAEQQAGPIFHGGDAQTKGVAGLAISSAGTGDVPIEAFAEFVRMSLGMPRIRGYTFLDDPISKTLFFPQNVSAEHLSPGQRETSADAKSVLDYLNQYILRNSAVKLVPRQSPSDVPAKSILKDVDVPLALFDAVIFPGWSMPIHIYEPRYRIMVKQCMEQGKPFGLSSSLTAVHSKTMDSDEIIGTIVNLKVHLFEKDCRSYIIASGVERFRVADNVTYQPGSFGLALGQVRFFDDTVAESAKERREVADLAKEAIALCQRIMPEMREVPGLVGSSGDPKLASFALGHLLPVPNLVKTRWLGMEDTKARLMEQMTFLEKKAGK